MKKQQGNKKGLFKYILYITIILAVIAILTPILFKDLKFGLDLQGGFEVLYQVKSIDNSEVTSDMVTSTYKTIQKRIDVLGVSEPVITIEGNDKIRVQLAGVTDPEQARSLLSTAANLTFRDTNDNLLMNSDVLKSGGAKVGQDSSGMPAVSLSVADKEEFYKVTKKVSEMENNQIVIWLDFDEETDSYASEQAKCGSLSDSKCLSAASVSQGFASDVIIQGNFSQEEVENLVELINSGSLPTKLEEISSKTVAASFGSNSLDKTFKAGVVGIVLIMLFMIAIYKFSGFIASIGIIIYTFLTFLTFWLVGGVLTLPGIAAIVLGIGMAIDSNVISFSRIKDELKNGRSFKTAVKLGNKNAFLTILDANLTTLIVAIILFIFGESSVKGFATTLIISIFVTMFIMVFLTRILLNLFVKTGYFDNKYNLFIGYKETKKENKFDFIKNTRLFVSVSVLIIILGTVVILTSGLNLGIDFKGGSSITIKSNNKVTETMIKEDVEKFNYNIEDIEFIDDNTTYIKIDELLENDQIQQTEKYFNDKYDASTEIGVVSNIVKRELIKNAIISVLIASISIIIYISMRYKFSYAISGIIALLHDVLIIIAIFAVFKLEVSSIFIAAILSIIGYSINDTIVTFDRIKENLEVLYNNKIKNKDQLKEVVNLSLRQTFTRSIITSITTIIPVLCLIFLGSYEIINFNLTLLIGLIAGSYSSIFIASQLWYFIESKNINKPKKKKWYEDNEKEELKVKGINS